MWEVEVKVRCDHAHVESRLKELGAEPLADAFQRDSYYCHPCRDFVTRDEALRLREQGAVAEITFKGPRMAGRTKTRSEVNLQIDDAGAARELLSGLGFAPVATVEKRRRTYRLGGATVCLDEVDGLGEFVEVEVRTREGDGTPEVAAAQQHAIALLERLDLPPETETRSYLEMLADEKK